MTTPVFGVIGWKNSGKTTLMVRLVEEFTRRGYTVSAVKHAHHTFDIDHPGRDSYLFREAGARHVALASPKRWAVMRELREEAEPPFAEILSHIGPCDLILVEGYKSGAFAKIEARSTRSLTREPLSDNDTRIVAIASDGSGAGGPLPHYSLDDIVGIADFIRENLGLKRT